MSIRQRTQLWLEIGNTKDFRFGPVANLRFNPCHYRIDVDKQSTAIRINESFFLATVEYGRGIAITNTLLNHTVKTRRYVIIYPWQKNMVKGICSGPHYAALMVLERNGQLLNVVILRDLDSTPPRYPFVVGDPPQTGTIQPCSFILVFDCRF